MINACGDVVAYETGILLLQFSSVLFFASVAGGISLSADAVQKKRSLSNGIPETAEVVEIQEASTVPSVPEVVNADTSSFWPDEPRYHRTSFEPQAVMTQRRPRSIQDIIKEQHVTTTAADGLIAANTAAAAGPAAAQSRPVTISFDMSQDMQFHL